jgi:hypothetical protein
VIDPALKPIARDALVLRRLTVEMIPAVLKDRVPKGLTAAQVFERLSREMGLVEEAGTGDPRWLTIDAGTGVLRLRPELRAATLHLLEVDGSERVREIDKRAAAWYAKQDLADEAIAAELVYHRLRLGDLKGADAAWRDDLASLVLFTEEDLPLAAKDSKRWLAAKLKGVSAGQGTTGSWEKDAVKRLREVLARGHVRGVADILTEHTERTAGSPLVLYDAWQLWQYGKLTAARQLLADAKPGSESIERDRMVLAARLAAIDGDRRRADELLLEISGGSSPDVEAAQTIMAARIRLTIDLDSEAALTEMLGSSSGAELLDAVVNILPPPDVVMPSLATRVSFFGSLETAIESVAIPSSQSELGVFATWLDVERSFTLKETHPVFLPVAGTKGNQNNDAWRAAELKTPMANANSRNPKVNRGIELARDLAVLGWRRWRLVTTSFFLDQACKLALNSGSLWSPEAIAIVGTLGAFHGSPGNTFTLTYRDRSLHDLLERAAPSRVPTTAPPPTEVQISRAEEILKLNIGATDTAEFGSRAPDLSHGSKFEPPARGLVEASGPDVGLAFYLLSPDPLEMLVRRTIGVPDSLPL